MKDIECPYCEHYFELDLADGEYYQEDNGIETECPNCDKTFLVFGSVLWSWEGTQADCLNGSPHNWSDWRKMWDGEKEHKSEVLERRYCVDCDKSEQEYHPAANLIKKEIE